MTQVATMASTERDLTSSSDEQQSRPTSRDGFKRYKKTEGPLFVNRHSRGNIWEQDRERRARVRALREEERAVGARTVSAPAAIAESYEKDVANATASTTIAMPIAESNRITGGGWMDGPRRMTLTEAWARTADIPEDDTFQSRRSASIGRNNSAIQNTPSEWGTKARREPGWMRKILEPDEAPLPSIEDGSAIPTPPASIPASSPQPGASPEKSKIWDADLDFTAHSLQVSTSPQLRVRSSKLDEIRSREIQNLTARAVATSRLEEIRERNSEERSINSEAGTNTKEILPNEDVTAEGWSHKSILEEEGEKIPYTPITVFRAKDFEEYVKRNNIKFGRDRSDSMSSSSSRPRSSEGNLLGPKPKVFAPNFGEGFKKKRDEQRELLRRLSRACSRSSSASPAPPKVEEKEETVNHSEEVNDSKKPDTLKSDTPIIPRHSDEMNELKNPDTLKSEVPNHLNSRNDLHKPDIQQPDIIKPDASKPEESNHSDPEKDLKRSETPASKSDIDPEERITAEARLFDLQDNKSERNSIRAPSPAPSDDEKLDETPRPKANPLSLPTPRVTGAFIETPAPTTRVITRSRSISPSYEVVDVPEATKSSKSKALAEQVDAVTALSERYRNKRETRKRSITPPRGRFYDARPPLINTAKPASAAEDLRRIQLEAQVEDSTLDDFDAIIDAEAATEGQTTILEPVLDLQYDERGLPLSEKEIERRIERLTLDRMNQSLKATSTSIRDARHGIERLEEQVSSKFIKIGQPDDGTMYINMKIPVPKLYISKPSQKFGIKRGWTFTWFGLIAFLFFLWYLCESAMCSQFCHPVASNKNTWQPSDPFFPWAIPTKLDQWTGEVVSSSLDSVAKGLGIRSWDWSPLPTLAPNYKGGPIGSSDWWLGRNGPVGLMLDDRGTFDDDEMI